MFLLICCTSSTTDSEPDIIDRISGLYYLSGEKKETGNIGSEDQYTITSGTTFTINIKLIREKRDTIRLYGLEGADAGEFENRVFPECIHPEDCRVYATLNNPEEFEIHITNEGRSYRGSGIVRTSDITMDAIYEYDTIIIEYSLSGKSIY